VSALELMEVVPPVISVPRPDFVRRPITLVACCTTRWSLVATLRWLLDRRDAPRPRTQKSIYSAVSTTASKLRPQGSWALFRIGLRVSC